MKPVGAAAKRRQREWANTVVAVFEREGQMCECCQRETAVDAHHCFGRSNQIPRRYADTPELVVAVCRPCHTEVTDNPRSYWANVLRIKAAERFARKLGINYYHSFMGFTPLQAVREMIRELEAKKVA